VGDGSNLCRADDTCVVVLSAHDDHRDVRRALAQRARRLGRVRFGKSDVDEKDVGGDLVDDRDGFSGRRHISEHLDVRRTVQDLEDADAENRARLYDDEPNCVLAGRGGRTWESGQESDLRLGELARVRGSLRRTDVIGMTRTG
jgi:hypothetical protein